MARAPHPGEGNDTTEAQLPWVQRLYDNIWLLFALSLACVFGFYLIWGFVDLINVPRLP